MRKRKKSTSDDTSVDASDNVSVDIKKAKFAEIVRHVSLQMVVHDIPISSTLSSQLCDILDSEKQSDRVSLLRSETKTMQNSQSHCISLNKCQDMVQSLLTSTPDKFTPLIAWWTWSMTHTSSKRPKWLRAFGKMSQLASLIASGAARCWKLRIDEFLDSIMDIVLSPSSNDDSATAARDIGCDTLKMYVCCICIVEWKRVPNSGYECNEKIKRRFHSIDFKQHLTDYVGRIEKLIGSQSMRGLTTRINECMEMLILGNGKEEKIPIMTTTSTATTSTATTAIATTIPKSTSQSTRVPATPLYKPAQSLATTPPSQLSNKVTSSNVSSSSLIPLPTTDTGHSSHSTHGISDRKIQRSLPEKRVVSVTVEPVKYLADYSIDELYEAEHGMKLPPDSVLRRKSTLFSDPRVFDANDVLADVYRDKVPIFDAEFQPYYEMSRIAFFAGTTEPMAIALGADSMWPERPKGAEWLEHVSSLTPEPYSCYTGEPESRIPASLSHLLPDFSTLNLKSGREEYMVKLMTIAKMMQAPTLATAITTTHGIKSDTFALSTTTTTTSTSTAAAPQPRSAVPVLHLSSDARDRLKTAARQAEFEQERFIFQDQSTPRKWRRPRTISTITTTTTTTTK